jgi:hypothetical protein
LTEPIVEKTLRPLLDALGERPRAEEILELKVCDPAMGSGAFLVAACRALGDELVKAWTRHGMKTGDEDPVLLARRLVAQRCLYGVDKNPFAVDLAKLSLWLVTLAKDHAFTFVDHALRCGDSLVGLSKEQIASFDWAPEAQVPMLRKLTDEKVQQAEALRAKIQAMAASDDTREKQRLLRDAEDALFTVRRIGDLVIEAFFSEAKDRARRERRKALESEVLASLDLLPEAAEAERLRPFHWELEFPEVFSRANAGFDAFVGNPPFSGKNGVVAIHPAYLDWLQTIHEGAHGNADLVAHFFRRTFGLLRQSGALGLIATNTIAQGDTRSAGLRWILTHGGVLYNATRRYKWPTGAAVIVSVLHILREGRSRVQAYLDGKPVDRISAFLFHSGSDAAPVVLLANANKSFIGSYIHGAGFYFDDTNPAATPIVEMHRLIAKDSRNQDRIFPYVGGEEVNTSPIHAHHRHVINFAQMTEQEARRWPDLIAIVEAKVRPERAKLADNPDGRRRKQNWWQWGRYPPALYEAIRGHETVLFHSSPSTHSAFVFLSTHTIVAAPHNVFVLESASAFGLLQSRTHEIWARFLGSSMKDDLRYTPSDCFETFPFPPGWETHPILESAGQTYYDFRAELMVKNDQGLTATYNRFHDPDERDPEILRLRELHAAMDRAVLDAYGWTDLEPRCEFLLDYEDDEDDGDSAGKKRKKKPWRYRWPDELRDEVLARLLALNAERAAEEKRRGDEAKLESAAKAGASKPKRASKKKPAKAKEPDLFPEPEGS